MTAKEMAMHNETEVLKAYDKLKDDVAFKALEKMMKEYKLALETGVGHVTIEKILKANSIEL